MKRKRANADEQDAFSRYARRLYSWRAGEIRKLKRQSAKRERRVSIEAECCGCPCQHEHRYTGVIPWDSCVMCKWCMCHQHARGVDKVPPEV